MRKPHVTRTYGQIHFEDLEPKRFEDLVSELIYDYKEWQNIEATGRSGNDSGFDIRAFEKNDEIIEKEEDEEVESISKEGNLWMVQVKREKVINPKRIEEILADVDSKNPPYGYILAASANFSKRSYDIFRDELKKKNVMEFHLWGKAELEHMLYQTKNDRILFAFFGISLVSKRRSKSVEVRAKIANKNKIISAYGESPHGRDVLIRNINDDKYPFEKGCNDFASRPSWKEYKILKYHPLGLVISIDEHFAYVDEGRKEFDFCSILSLAQPNTEDFEIEKKNRDTEDKIKNFWEQFPIANQAHYYHEGLLKFEDMLAIDKQGDSLYTFPQIFVDFDPENSFSGFWTYCKSGYSFIHSVQDYKRIKIFPKSIPEPRYGKLHDDKEIKLASHYLHRLNHRSEDFKTLYSTDERYAFLEVSDALGIPCPDARNSGKNYIRITRIASVRQKDYLERNPNKEYDINDQVGREVAPDEVINVYEFSYTWDWKYREKKST
jgi:hypothetical protein